MMSQELLAAKSEQLHGTVDELVGIVTDAIKDQTPIHEVESKAYATLLRAGRMTLQLPLDCLGNGDLGPTHQLPEGRTVKRSEETRTRTYMSIFGTLQIERYVYAQREGQPVEFAPLDARLALPESKFSYLLQDWDQNFTMEQPFDKVTTTVEKILGLQQHVDSLERMSQKMAEHADYFQDAQEAPPADEEGEIFVQTGDGKGVPIRHAADAPLIRDHRHQRGPKPDRKKMATVGAVYSVDRFVRTPQEVIDSLFRDPQQERPKRERPRPCHKRMRAMLNHTNAEGDEINGRSVVFGWISDEIRARHSGSNKPIICIMDGEKALWDMRDVFQQHVPMVDILDLLHVTPRLWNAAALFYSRGSDEAEKFVRERVLRILQGHVKSVIRGLRRMATTHKLRGKKLQDLRKICRYFENNRERMRYHEYLALGYPIASGVIEGACRHIVKDRLERTGMSWSIQGAQAMLDLRCIYLTNAWDAFIEFRIEREIERLYPYRDELESLPWSIAA